MATGIIYVTAPAVVAAAGIYLLERKHYKTEELGGGFWASMKNLATKAKDDMKSANMPKLAPQFDGLHCFETLVDN